MQAASVEVYQAVVPENTGLYVPWGFIVAEASMNSAQTTGIRWMSYMDAYTPGFKMLVKHLLPSDPSKVRPGTAAHFLVKICAHLTNKAPAEIIKEELHSRGRKRPTPAHLEPAKKVIKGESK